MKIGIVGKGGTGKTTISALLCQLYARRGRRVLAVDTDSSPNLAMSLGLDEAVAAGAPLVPRSLQVGEGDLMSPAQLLEDYGLATPSGVTLLHAMRVDQAGAGCTCTSHASVRSLLAATLDDEADVTLVDMEAGLEHLSRSGGTLAYVDIALVVMEPTRKSVITAARTQELAIELGIPRVEAVGNKARSWEDIDLFDQAASEYGFALAGVVPFDPAVATAEREGFGPGLPSASIQEAVERIIRRVDSPELRRQALVRQRQDIEARLAELTGTV